MPEDTQALLRAAAVIGRDIDTLLLETTAGLDNERVLSLLEPAVATGLLVEVAGRWDYRFTHALVRDALYAELSRLQRARIHRRVGEALETLHAVDDPAAVGLLAITSPPRPGSVRRRRRWRTAGGPRGWRRLSWPTTSRSAFSRPRSPRWISRGPTPSTGAANCWWSWARPGASPVTWWAPVVCLTRRSASAAGSATILW
jgi:hypothetical protein